MAARSLDAACNHCMRHVGALGRVLCREHRRGQRVSGDLPLEQFLVLPHASALSWLARAR